LGPLLTLLFFGMNQPPFGLLIFGISLSKPNASVAIERVFPLMLLAARMGFQGCTVVGAGVIGLSCGIRLLESGLETRILSKDVTPHTVSDIAAAWWYPFLAEPVEKTTRWSVETYYELLRLKEDLRLGFITMRKGVEYLVEPCPPPGWAGDISHFRAIRQDEVIEGYQHGWEIEAPVIEMGHYLPWLMERFLSLGGDIELTNIASLSDINSRLVVNCTGLGARDLCQDENIVPVRGQIIYIDQDPGFGRFDQRPENLIYTIPRRDVTVLGGTAQRGDWHEEIRKEDTLEILQKCSALWPELDRSKIIGEAVGLRPSRNEVRLEVERSEDSVIIHNYGHGGAGVTLSWGCADEVTSLAQGLLET
jgi:D-amino-acid oxidase